VNRVLHGFGLWTGTWQIILRSFHGIGGGAAIYFSPGGKFEFNSAQAET
jgi:hypothetical protein